MKKILVVEDNTANRYLIQFLLEQEGYKVIEASSGEEGVALALKEKIDLVLMDIQLPGIDGLETTRRIRQSEAGRDVPIIAVTSYAMIGDREKVLEAGCTAYLEKPIDPDTILDEIRAYL